MGKDIMKSIYKKMIMFITVHLCIGTAAASSFGNVYLETEFVNEVQDLYLMRSEHYLYITASDDVNNFHVKFAFPPDYNYQVPVLLEVYNDTDINVTHYKIENDHNEPNKVVNFTIDSIEKDETVLIHFSYYVLVKNHEFDDLPKYVKFPTEDELPEETKKWLVSSEVVQVDNVLIRSKARQLRGINNNLIRFAGRIAPFIKYHRYVLFLLQLNLRFFFPQDAITTLFINGENIGRSHLACAFFRANNVPARVLMAHNDQGFWTQMHFMVEYYCPDYGWVLIDSTKGKTPYATKRQIINRVCYPEDEGDTRTDYIYPLMKGVEKWIWIDNENVHPYYVDCDEGSKSQMFYERNLTIDSSLADVTFNKTKNVFIFYQCNLGLNLTGENLLHFQNATSYQKQAVSELIGSDDPDEYIYYIDKAIDEYNEIDL